MSLTDFHVEIIPKYTYLHLHTARAPWASQSAFCPQGSCEQGLSLHLTKGSPIKLKYQFSNFQIVKLMLFHIERLYMIFYIPVKPLGHLQIALAPVFSHSAFIPQGSWSQGLTWQFEYGSP